MFNNGDRIKLPKLQKANISTANYLITGIPGSGKTTVGEILSADVLQNGSSTAVSDKELKMAQALIESMAVAWEPEKYRDEYRTALMEIIEQKAQHKEITAKAPAAPTPTNVVDLVKVLQDSLNRTQAVKQKRSSTRDGARRSTSTLVKQRRGAGALG